MTTSPARNPNMRATLRKAAEAGRRGDDRIAHINGYEAAVLKSLGGAGTINPKTGLEEYGPYQGGHGGGQGKPDPNDKPNAGGRGGGFGGGPSSVGEGLSTRERNLRDIENLAAGRPSAIAGASGRPSAGGGTGQGGRGGTTLVGNDTTANYQAAKKAGVSPDQYNKEVTDYTGRIRDSLDTDNTTVESIGNMISRFLGFNETPVEDLDFNPQKPTGPRADWSWDLVPALASLGGTLAGLPFGPGLIADLASQQLGRPLAFNLGPDVIGGPSVDPETGETIAGETTFSGPNMTFRGGGNDNEFLGVSPGLGALAGGASNATPTKKTFTGVDPATGEPAPEPQQPGMELPDGLSPTELPGGVTVDPGNSQIPASELMSIFQNYGNRVYRGKNRSTVVT